MRSGMLSMLLALASASLAQAQSPLSADELAHRTIERRAGSYTKGELANNSLNNWTFTPAVGYTRLFQQGTLELSALAGVDIYTKNDATNYQNGSVFRLDTMLTKHLPNEWAFGLVGGWLEQIDDSGSLADRLNGFKGHSFGIGPSVSYAHHFSKTSSATSLRSTWKRS